MKQEDKDKLNLNEDELISLYQIVKEYFEDLPEDMDDWYHDHGDFDEEPIDRKEVLLILKKLEKIIPEEDKEEIDKGFLRQKYHPYNNEINGETYEVIEKAFNQLKTIEIEYFSMGSANFKKRKIDVYYKSRKYIIAYCYLRKDMRKFRTSRIASAKLTKEKYKIPKDFDKNNY